MTGIADVAKQQIIWQLLERNSHLVSADFFKKFRSFLLIKDKVLVFKKGGLTGLKTACMVGSRANFCCPLFYSWYYQFTDMNRFLLGDI
ncbi:Uncharacterised protein [Edwardsiella hoshinae]|uniref:Uncharacterized protein n=2 Tax=Edwardsiella hoshinae TaxID=93378 RepID=A0A376D743_9GAMM|nr:Uncharacterised protein [Edwardsiella hoshinae]